MKSILLLALTASAWAADAQHGSTVVQDQSCLECHTVNAQGSGHEANATAPDLACEFRLRLYALGLRQRVVESHSRHVERNLSEACDEGPLES